MAKKATDMLDVFRLGSAESAPSRKRRSSAKQSRPAARRASSSADGIQLGGRQLLLASCVGVLLIVLAFTVGLGVGRRGLTTGGPQLNRPTAIADHYWIRGQLPGHDRLIDAPVNPSDVVRELQQVHKIPHGLVAIRRLPKDGALEIDVGPFPSKTDAEAFRSARSMKMIRLPTGSPFRFAEVVAVPARR